MLKPATQVDQRVQRLDRDRNDDELARLLKKHEEVGGIGESWGGSKGFLRVS